MGAEPGEGVAAVGIVGAEGSHIVPDCEVGEAEGEDALAEGFDFDGADGFDAEEKIGEESAAGAWLSVFEVWEVEGGVAEVVVEGGAVEAGKEPGAKVLKGRLADAPGNAEGGAEGGKAVEAGTE